jgi:hypothetical protein
VNEFEIDWDRARRTGTGEAVYCIGKTAEQIASIVGSAADRPMLLTRLAADTYAALPTALRDSLDYDPASRTAFSGAKAPQAKSGIGIVCAGTSDLAVAREAARTLEFHGLESSLIADVGVAGLWRLLRRLEELRRFSIVIVIAGMEGALFGVVSGLIDCPIIAVPTSVGYGVSAGGRLALDAALACCAPGVTVVNIDNGFGAACAAARIHRLVDGRDKVAASGQPATPQLEDGTNAVAIGPGVWLVNSDRA